MNIEKLISDCNLGILFVIFAIFSIFALRDNSIFNFSISNIYFIIVFAFLGIVMLSLLFENKFKSISNIFNYKIKRLINYVIFLPLAVYPILKCYFKIPYIFCHVCPSKCVFGYLRPYVVPGALLINLDKKHWCMKMCPLGYFQDNQRSVKTIILPKAAKHIGIIILILIGASYFLIRQGSVNIEAGAFNLYLKTFKNVYSLSIGVLIAVGLFFIGSFFIRRLWCNYFCPIGNASDIIRKVEEKVLK